MPFTLRDARPRRARRRAPLVMVALLASLGCGAPSTGALDAALPDGGARTDASAPRDASTGADAPSLPAEYLIVLVPAFHATTTNDWSMQRVATFLESEGRYVHLADIPQYAATPVRAEALAGEIDRARAAYCAARHPAADPDACVDSTRVHLVGHSQGGLDARFVVSNLGYGPYTASVTTLSTPHRGTPLGDVALSLVADPRAEWEAGSTLRAAVRELLERLVGDSIFPEGLIEGLYWLSEARFHAQEAGRETRMEDVETVRYFSWAGVATSDGELPDVTACGAMARFPMGVAAELRGVADNATFTLVSSAFSESRHFPNDGHIPVLSAIYGSFQGCLPTDHLDLIARPDDQVDENRALTGLDLAVHYRALSAQLSAIE